MEVTVTVLTGDGPGEDVRVHCRPDARVAELMHALVRAGVCDGSTGRLYAGDRHLQADAAVGSVLAHGSVLRQAPLPPPQAPLRELRVVGGLRVGASHLLAAGPTVLGRGPLADVDLDDPRVSRAHARVTVDGRGVTVTDLGSTNGSALDGRPLPAGSLPWTPGARLRLGDTVLQLAHPEPSSAPTAALSGRFPVAATPRLRAPAPQVEVRFPDAPPPARRARFPVAAAVAPLLVGVVAALVLRSPTFLLFALLSPVVVIAGAASERGHARRDERDSRRRHDEGVRKAQATLAEALRAEAVHRHDADLDGASLRALVGARGGRLWERRWSDDDVLRVRLGTADLPARVRVTGGPSATCPAVPVTVDLRAVGGLGVVGSRQDALALARAVVTGAAALHPPSVLQVVVLEARGRDDWRWARWLPHARRHQQAPTRDRLAELVARLGDGRDEPSPTQARVLVVVDDPSLRDRPELARLTAGGPASGVRLLCLATDPGDLPPACSALLVDDGAAQGWVLRQDGLPPVSGICPDGVSAAWAEETARLLAPLVQSGDEGTDAGLPADVAWRDLAELDLTGEPGDAAVVLDRWSRSSPGPTFPLGLTTGGQVTVDLRRDGPHCLVAGTTGSGKSELLQTLVAGLALANPPEALQLLLVDYKGGAAFGSCSALPHTAGVVTDLDTAATRRALASLAAELRRREALLSEAGVPDLDAYARQRSADPPGTHALAALPRLVIVVDEFATLAEELPEFVRGLVAVAQRGRSLGVHLVLATQRPEGSVSQDIRANTALRLCLAVARDAESRDVIDAPDAARIGRHLPGRGYLRRGAEGLVLVQAARVTVPRRLPGTADQPLTVRLLAADEPSDAGTGPARLEDRATDLDLLVAACRAAAGAREVPPPARPWLPPLPDRLLLPDLTDRPQPGPPEDTAGPGAGPVPFALQDEPSRQRQRVLSLDLRGHLAVVGGPRSGRTTTLVTIAGAAAKALPPDRLHVVGLDFGGTALSALQHLPHCGTVVTGDEPERLARLVAALTREVARRRTALRDRHSAADAAVEPHLLVLLDQWDALVATHADVDAGRLVDGVARVLREGPAVGVTAVVTSDRTALVGRIAGLLPRRLLLRLPDPGDYAAAGVAARDVPADLPPGRGVDDEGLLTQVALLDVDAVADPREALARAAAEWPAPLEGREPLRVDPLPSRVTPATAEALRGAPRPAGRLLTVGVGGDRLGPVDVDLDDTGPLVVVAGPPRAGRSSTLCTLVRSALGQRSRGGALPPQVVVVAPRPSPVRALGALSAPGATVTVVTDPGAADLLEHLLARPSLLVVDDAELLADTSLAPVLDAAVASARDDETVVLAAGTTTALLAAYRGWVVDARRGRTGLLLTPESAADGELFGCRLPRSTGAEPAPPGRGLLVVRGAPVPLQVALTEGAGRPAAGSRAPRHEASDAGMRDVA